MAWVYWDDLEIKFNDLMVNWYPGRSYHTLEDGLDLGDTAIPLFRPQPNLADGISLGDSGDFKATVYVQLADGVTLSDANQEYFFEQLTDGVVLTDWIIYKKEKSELDISFTAKETVYSFPGTIKIDRSFTIKDLEEQKLTWQPVLETFGVKSITVSFTAKGKEFTFTAKETDDSFKK